MTDIRTSIQQCRFVMHQKRLYDNLVWRQKKFSKNSAGEFEKRSCKESNKRCLLFWSELRSEIKKSQGHTFEVQRRVFSLSQFTNISNAFELYRSLLDRKERGSFTFSAQAAVALRVSCWTARWITGLCSNTNDEEYEKLSSTSKSMRILKTLIEIGEVSHLKWPIAQCKTKDVLTRRRSSLNHNDWIFHFILKSSLDSLAKLIINLIHWTQWKHRKKTRGTFQSKPRQTANKTRGNNLRVSCKSCVI